MAGVLGDGRIISTDEKELSTATVSYAPGLNRLQSG